MFPRLTNSLHFSIFVLFYSFFKVKIHTIEHCRDHKLFEIFHSSRFKVGKPLEEDV
uniref:Uncharacterized protein n=1 Tax=Rhizophora mucronata TaxID=61149 RepID=A0A2P2QA45_RHIMU